MDEKRSPHYRALTLSVYILIVINITVLIALLVMYGAFVNLKKDAGITLSSLISSIERLQSSTIEYTVVLNQDIPITGDIPIDIVVAVPINTTLPVDTTVTVPIDFPIVGIVNINVPITANIPVNISVDVPLQETIPIDISVPIALEIPVNISIADTPLAQSIDELYNALCELATRLGVTLQP